MSLTEANILVTGGTGSFGRRFVHHVLRSYSPERLIVFSRDEAKQFHMRQQFPVERYPNLRMLIGDVRDHARLSRAMDGVDVVVHAAALKQVPTAEHNPIEAIKTNILGATNIVDCAVDRHVSKVLALSTDKAVNPVNLYGATKLCADKVFVAAHGAHSANTRFSVVRYGNVVGSRGSVIPYFLTQRATGRLTITDLRMTRFLITGDQAVEFAVDCLERMQGGEIVTPKIPSVRIIDLASEIGPNCRKDIIGIRPGEKLHETLISEDEARLTLEFPDRYLIQPTHSHWRKTEYDREHEGRPCEDGFEYSSHTNSWWLTGKDIAKLIAATESDPFVDHPSLTEPHFIVGG